MRETKNFYRFYLPWVMSDSSDLFGFEVDACGVGGSDNMMAAVGYMVVAAVGYR